jgi:hypothetical protein
MEFASKIDVLLWTSSEAELSLAGNRVVSEAVSVDEAIPRLCLHALLDLVDSLLLLALASEADSVAVSVATGEDSEVDSAAAIEVGLEVEEEALDTKARVALEDHQEAAMAEGCLMVMVMLPHHHLTHL